MMITIYHNPRCRKSREGLEVLEQSGKPFRQVQYLKEPLGVEALRTLVDYLGIPAMELVRTNEPVWKEQYKGLSMTDEELIEAMAKHPKLIERPIVVYGQKAVIGRPPERIAALLKG